MLGTKVAEEFFKRPIQTKFSSVLVVIFAMALFTTVALTNIAVLGLLLTAPFAWRSF